MVGHKLVFKNGTNVKDGIKSFYIYLKYLIIKINNSSVYNCLVLFVLIIKRIKM